MENIEVKDLRKKYGIHDSRNEYTVEQLNELSKRKIYYINRYGDEETGHIIIDYKHVLGYISEDSSPCIFIKDGDITGSHDRYMPVKSIKRCTKIKEGIYQHESDDILFCTTDELQFCIEYKKEFIKKSVQEHIKELEDEILKFKNVKIVSEEEYLKIKDVNYNGK